MTLLVNCGFFYRKRGTVLSLIEGVESIFPTCPYRYVRIYFALFHSQRSVCVRVCVFLCVKYISLLSLRGSVILCVRSQPAVPLTPLVDRYVIVFIDFCNINEYLFL